MTLYSKHFPTTLNWTKIKNLKSVVCSIGQTTSINRCDIFSHTSPDLGSLNVKSSITFLSLLSLYFPTSLVTPCCPPSVLPFWGRPASVLLWINYNWDLTIQLHITRWREKDDERQGLKGEDERITSSLGVGEGEGGKSGMKRRQKVERWRDREEGRERGREEAHLVSAVMYYVSKWAEHQDKAYEEVYSHKLQCVWNVNSFIHNKSFQQNFRASYV